MILGVLGITVIGARSRARVGQMYTVSKKWLIEKCPEFYYHIY
jgi:hypothetical protein